MNILSRCQLDHLKRPIQTVLCDTIDNTMSKSVQVTDNDSAQSDFNNDTPLKTWNSLPALVKNNSRVIAENSAATSSTSLETGNINNDTNRSRSVELAEIINVNYSESRQPVNSNANQPAVKPKTLVKRRSRIKARQNQGKRTSKNPEASTCIREVAENVVEETTQPIAITESVEMKSVEQWLAPKKTSFLAGSAPEFTGPWSLEVEGQKEIRTPRKSFMEDGGSSVQPMATGYFPRPAEGQSLTSFLTSARFSRAHDAELDRENAHFSICEAMIAAIEQVKCNRLQRRMLDDAADDESDEEINRLKQRIRMRRRQRQEEKYRGRGWNRDLLSDGRTDTTTTTDQSVSPLSTSSGNISDSVYTDDSELDEQQNDSKSRHGMSASTASLYSDVESRQARLATDSTMSESSVSAEGVALSLISRFSEKQLPRASELQWLVSEKDAPQRLLPMPKSWPVSPDETEVEDTRTIPLRGTVEWAPPRPQIIFTPHAPPV